MKNRLDLHWIEVTERDHRLADPEDPLEFNRMEQRIVKDSDKVDFTMKDYEVASDTGRVASKGFGRQGLTRRRRARESIRRLVSYPYHSPRIYPSKMTSRLLSLKNMFLPLRNRKFALFVGMVYFIYAWAFEVSAPSVDVKKWSAEGAQASAAEAMKLLNGVLFETISPSRVLHAVRDSPLFFFMLLGLWVGLIHYVDLGKGALRKIGKVVLGTLHFTAHLTALLIVSLLAFAPSALFAALPALIAKTVGLQVSAGFADVFNQAWFLVSYALVSIFVGGFVGAAIMGCYWTLTCLLFNMHCGDAFGALMIRDYKHFLRMRFQPDKVTIYPIAIDRVPGRRGWRVPTAAERKVVASQIVPKQNLDPHLIEAPIVIEASSVRQ
ncbi:MAG: hypothetical protein R3D67_03955 [Hyphomicrobiaceae bacterium]